MRVMRGRSFEAARDNWQKIEIELDSNDLLADEIDAPARVQPILLGLRAEQNIVAFLHEMGHISSQEAKEEAEKLKALRKTLMQ